MPETRQADYHLGCLGGSVFIDFNLNNIGQVYLKRISFDGYGCCEIKKTKTLDQNDSIIFVTVMDKELTDYKVIEGLVNTLIRFNSNSIWSDALEEYKLFDK